MEMVSLTKKVIIKRGEHTMFKSLKRYLLEEKFIYNEINYTK